MSRRNRLSSAACGESHSDLGASRAKAKVIDALVSLAFNRNNFLRSLDRFYGAIEDVAHGLDEFEEK